MQRIRTSVLAAPVLIGLMFLSTLVGVDRLAFRDVSHFYTPLYDYVAWRTSSQWLPLWNPLDQTGIPLVGDTTSAVFYPVRYLLFSLPISSEVAIAWYVVLHLILASVTAGLAARWSGVGPIPAAIAGAVYPLSGSVLFLYCNPPYLVSAAWLPLALGGLLARSPISASTRIVVSGVAMSMMVLGGDPQNALHAMFVAAAVWAGRMVRRRRPGIPIGVLLAAPILALALAAPQFAASVSWSRQSDRALGPRAERWIDAPLRGGTRHEAFEYSLPPWHLLEMITPNAFGSLLPVNQRISQLIPGDGRMWTPSIYMGMIVLVALCGRISRWRSMGIDAWTTIALASLCLAMGHFGVVWLMQMLIPGLSRFDSAIGGPYWWLYQFVPTYDSFRYPAKWLTVFALASAMVTAESIDSGLFRKSLGRMARWLGAALVTALVTTLLLRWHPVALAGAADPLPKDEFWGPLDIDGGLSQIGRSLIHSAIVMIALGLVLRWSRVRRWSDPIWKLALLVIVLVDLGISGLGMIARVPRDDEHHLLSAIDVSPDSDARRWMRTQSGSGWPRVWKETRDDNRLLDVESSVRAAWFGRWHLQRRASVLNNMVSLRSRQMAMFWRAAGQITAGMSSQQRNAFWASIRRWLAIDGVVHSSDRSVRIPIADRTAQMVDRSTRTGATAPPLRDHSDWRVDPSPKLGSREVADLLRRIAESDGSALPLVQAATSGAIRPQAAAGRQAVITVIADEAEHARFDVRLASPALLSRPVFQDGHWIAEFSPERGLPDDRPDWKSIAVHRVDHLTQGVLLPAGDWKLRFRYAPWWLPWSLGVATAAWLLAALLVYRNVDPGGLQKETTQCQRKL